METDKKTVLFATTFPAFLTPFMGSSINVALPSIGREFSMDAVQLTWVATAFLLGAAIFLVPFGRVGDLYGRKRVFLWGLGLYTLSGLLSALSPSGLFLIASRALQGIAGSMIFGTAVAILTSAFPSEERGKVLGINVGATYSGLSLGPLLGGLLTQHLGWRSLFWINVPLGLLMMGTVYWKLKEDWVDAQEETFDLVGALIYSLVLIALMLGLSRMPAKSGIVLLLLGLLGLPLLIRYETRIESPLFQIALFKGNRPFTFSNLAALINYSATFAVAFLLSLHLQYTKGLSPQEAGFVLVASPVVQAVFSPFAGRLSDRIEPRIVASIGMALTMAGLFALAFLDEETTVTSIIVSLIVLGLGFGLFSSPNTNAVMSSVDRRFYGVASGTLGTMRSLGMMLSMGICMLILGATLGRVEIAPVHFAAFLRGVKIAFVVFGCLSLAGIFASLARGRVRPNGDLNG